MLMSYKELSVMLKILSDPSRLEILDLLSYAELCEAYILKYFQFSQSSFIHHMKSLVDSNLVIKRKEGNKQMYQVNHDVLANVSQGLLNINTPSQACLCKAIETGGSIS